MMPRHLAAAARACLCLLRKTRELQLLHMLGFTVAVAAKT